MASSLVMALVCAFDQLPAQIVILGAFISITGDLFLSYLAQDDQREPQRAEVIERLNGRMALQTAF